MLGEVLLNLASAFLIDEDRTVAISLVMDNYKAHVLTMPGVLAIMLGSKVVIRYGDAYAIKGDVPVDVLQPTVSSIKESEKRGEVGIERRGKGIGISGKVPLKEQGVSNCSIKNEEACSTVFMQG